LQSILLMIKLFVVGFPREMDEMQLAQLFGPHGDIELLTIVRDKLTRNSKGFGFIQMKDAEGAQLAIEALDGMTFGDRTLEVRVAEDKPATAPPRRPSSAPRYQQQASRYPPQQQQERPMVAEKKKRPRLSK
jgi:RNA recognition motif-containing protein